MIQASASLPRMIQRGVDETLTLELYEDDGRTEVTPTAVEVAVYAGSTLVATLTGTAGVQSTAALQGSATTGFVLSEEWLEVWSVTVAGVVHQVRRDAYLVRHKLYPTVTVRDLLDRHPDLEDITSDLQPFLRAAWLDLQRELIQRGNRPQLILSGGALFDPLRLRALHLIYDDADQAVGDERYARLASRYRDAYERALAKTTFRYDSDEDGTLEEGDDKAARSSTLWGNMPPRSVYGGAW